jgi:hypothetical protein
MASEQQTNATAAEAQAEAAAEAATAAEGEAAARSARPTIVEVTDAREHVIKLLEHGLLSRKATSVKLAVVACAVALHAGERFASDSDAKRAFGVSVMTDVRRWVGLLAAMATASETPREARNRKDRERYASVGRRDRPARVPGREPGRPPKFGPPPQPQLKVPSGRKRGRPPMYGPKPRPPSPPPPRPPPPPRRSGVCGRRPPSGTVRCEGLTRLGQPCRVDSYHSFDDAKPLRDIRSGAASGDGGCFCAHHAPGNFTGTQCAGLTKANVRCRVFSGLPYAAAKPLRDGQAYCQVHAIQRHEHVRCAGVAVRRGLPTGNQCRMTSHTPFSEAAPLRDGQRFCSAHTAQDVPFVQCAGVTRTGEQCLITSWQTHTGAQPLRNGIECCALHTRPDEVPLSWGGVPLGEAAHEPREEAGACAWAAWAAQTVCAEACASCGVHGYGMCYAGDDGGAYCVRCWEAWDGVEPDSYVPLLPPPPSACAHCGRQDPDFGVEEEDGVFYCGPCARDRREARIDSLVQRALASICERRVREGATCTCLPICVHPHV